MFPEEEGFEVRERIELPMPLSVLRAEADALLARAPERGGARDALKTSAMFSDLASTEGLLSWAREVLGAAARAVRLTVFDKRAGANWKVPWHQDQTIAVRDRSEVEGFSTWSRKGSVWHVRPPVEVLESMLAVRLHLDDADAEHGALRVVPGSHRRGRLSGADLSSVEADRSAVTCPVSAGGVMAMRPLLLHASSACRRPARRRVLHFEYAGSDLPGGLEWPQPA